MIGGSPWWGWLIGAALISPLVCHAAWAPLRRGE